MLAVRLAITVLVALTVLAACGGNSSNVEEDRRFATDPGVPTASATVQATTAPAGQSTETPGTNQPSPMAFPPEASPVVIASSVQTIYALTHGAVVAFDVETGHTRVLCRSRNDDKVVRIAPSPDGAAVAIVWSRGQDRSQRYDLEIRSAVGEVLDSWNDIEAPLDQVEDPGTGRLVIDWSKSDDKIAVGFPDGGAVLVPLKGDPTVLLTRGQAPGPQEIGWSPGGDAIAFTSRRAGSKSAYLAIATARALPLDPVRIAGTGGDRPIQDLVWLPNGRTLLAVQGSAGVTDQVGGDVISVDRRTLKPEFVIGASRFGPAAQIVAVQVSPDGLMLGVVTVAPDTHGGLTASVWLMSDDLESQVRVDLPEDPPVGDIVWTTLGLSTTLIEPNGVQVVTVDRRGADVSVAAAPEASPEVPSASPEVIAPYQATPAASPAALPQVTPAASPAASPGATPQASD